MIRAPFALVDCYVSDARALSCCIIAAFPRFCLPHQWFALSLSLFFLFWFISFIIVTQATFANQTLAPFGKCIESLLKFSGIYFLMVELFLPVLSPILHIGRKFPPSQSRTNRYKIWRLWCSAWRYSCYSYGISLCVTATTRELFS